MSGDDLPHDYVSATGDGFGDSTVALIGKILEAGVSAPSGGNMQRWRFIVVRDAKIKQTVGAYYKRAWDEVVAPRYGRG
jgi:nitroreductase